MTTADGQFREQANLTKAIERLGYAQLKQSRQSSTERPVFAAAIGLAHAVAYGLNAVVTLYKLPWPDGAVSPRTYSSSVNPTRKVT